MNAPPIVFLHIFKCGGTSVIDRMRAVVGEENLFHFRNQSDFASQLDDPSSEVRRATVIAGHIPLRLIETHFPDSPVFTVLRDPIDRVISQYYHFRREGNAHLESNAGTDAATPENQLFRYRFCAENSFTDLVFSDDRRLRSLTQNHMTRRLTGARARARVLSPAKYLDTAVETLNRMAFAITTDEIDTDFLPLFIKTYEAQFGPVSGGLLSKPSQTMKNVSANRSAAKLSIDSKTLQHLTNQNRLDMALYSYIRWFRQP